jgi:hypothetical protein
MIAWLDIHGSKPEDIDKDRHSLTVSDNPWIQLGDLTTCSGLIYLCDIINSESH